MSRWIAKFNEFGESMFINLWSELCSVGCSAGGQRLPVPRNSRWHGCQQAPAARPRPNPWRKEAYKLQSVRKRGGGRGGAWKAKACQRHPNYARHPYHPIRATAAPFPDRSGVSPMPKQSRAEVGIAQTKCCVELSERGRKRHPDIQRDNIRGGAGREGANVRGVPRSFGSRTRSPISTLTLPSSPIHPCLANGEIP